MENRPELPLGWKWVRLGEVIKSTQSGTWGDEPFEAPKEEVYIVIRSTEIDHNGVISIKDEKVAQRRVKPETARKYFLKPNDLLVVRSGGTTGKIILGRVGIYLGEPDKYLFSNFLLKAQVDEKLALPEFLWRYLNWNKFLEENIPNLMRRTTGIQNLPMDEYFSILIPLPPLSEQKRIAAKLKEMMSEIDNARLACEKQLEAAKALPSAYLREVFESEEVKKWERKRLGEVLEIIESGSRPKGGVFEIKEGIPSIGAEHLNSFGGFNFDNMRFIPKDFFEVMNRGKIQKRDVLVVKDGATTGKVSFVGNNFPYAFAAINEHVFRLRSKDFLEQEFLFLFLYSPLGQTQIQREFHGATQGGINQQFVNGVYISIPPLPEQKRIAEYLKEKITQAEKLKAAIEKELATINSLPQSILSKAFRGEL